MSPRDRIQRRVLPRGVVALSTVGLPRRVAATVRRALGGSATVRLYVAFDDPSSAVALLGLAERTVRRRAQLVVEPVVARGIPGDPAVEAKRTYAVLDAARLARRDDRTLSRSAPVAPQDVAFLADWALTVEDQASRARFCAAAMRRLWFESDGAIVREPYADLWRAEMGTEPPHAVTDPNPDPGVRPSERGMRLRRLYDTPVAVVGGQWFFAHERLAAVEHRLDELGWRAAA